MSIRRLFRTVLSLCVFVLAGQAGCADLFDDPAGLEHQGEEGELVVEILSGPASLTNVTSSEFEFECNREEGCDFRCRLDDSADQDCTSPLRYDELDDGSHTFRVAAIDQMGEESEPAAWHWTIDTEAPLVLNLEGPPTVTNEPEATFEFECSKDDCEFTCELTGAAEGVVESATTCDTGHDYAGLADDNYTFSVYATDTAGNVGPTASWSWSIDTVGLIIAILDRPPTVTNENWANFEFECVDEPSCTFQCALDYDDGSGSTQSGSWESCSSPHLVDELVSGVYTLHIEATDDSGNQAAKSLTWTVMIPWEMVSAGSSQSCGVQKDGSLWCWGFGKYGRLGLGDTDHRRTPQQVGDHNDWLAVSTGWRHTCGVRYDGSLWCWGNGARGRLGLGDDTDDRLIAEQVGGHTDWSAVSVHTSHTCGARGDGSLWCWGNGARGRLGLGDTSGRFTPERVGNDSDWSSLARGSAHTCGVRDDRSLWCWGNGKSGQLGYGGDDNRLTPERVGDHNDWSTVSAAAGHTCGVRDDGSLWCWGNGDRGQLGLGDTEQRFTPEQVGTDTDWASVSTGWGGHTCGVRDHGSLWCWGNGDHGQLGLGDTDNRYTPEQVGTDTDWASVSAGTSHTCGVRDDGLLWCWGRGNHGQLGLGNTDDHLLPQQLGEAP